MKKLANDHNSLSDDDQSSMFQNPVSEIQQIIE